MFCPRCRTENGDAAIRCAGCGAPIAIGDDRPSPVDAPLDLDRRARTRLDAPGWESLRPVPLDWEMAPPAEATPGPDRGAQRVPPRRVPVARLVPPSPQADPAPSLPAVPAGGEAVAADPGFDLEVEEDEPEAPAVMRRARAPAWRRVASWAVDGGLLAAASAAFLVPVLVPAVGPDGLASLRGAVGPSLVLVALVAFAYLWLGTALMGATPGLRTAGLRIVGPDGRRPSPGQAALRSAAAVAAGAALGLGLLLALLNREGRAAHDLAAGTWVVLALPEGRSR